MYEEAGGTERSGKKSYLYESIGTQSPTKNWFKELAYWQDIRCPKVRIISEVIIYLVE